MHAYATRAMCKHVKSLRSAELEQTVLAATTRRLFGCVCVCVLCATRVFKVLFFVDFPGLYPNLISDLRVYQFCQGLPRKLRLSRVITVSRVTVISNGYSYLWLSKLLGGVSSLLRFVLCVS